MRIPYYRSQRGDSAGAIGGPVPGVLVIAATYGFFLLFAEFALLKLFEADPEYAGAAWRGLPYLGAGGIVGSLAAALLYRGHQLRQGLVAGFSLCAVSATVAALGLKFAPLTWIAFGTGLGLGLLTVTVASGLHRIFSAHTLGFWTALGTGLAYAACNIPGIFRAPPTMQAGMSVALCLLGVAAGVFVNTDLPPGGAGRMQVIGGPLSFWALLAAFVVLVGFDSAAFALILKHPGMRAASWTTDGQLWANALVHLVAALLAGWMLERGMIRAVLVLAGADLVLASAELAGLLPTGGLLQWLYPAGVSLYSSALVVLPSLSRRWPAAPAGAWRAAWLYILAGWIGSAVGIGVATQRTTLSSGMIATFVVALAVVLPGAKVKRGATV